MALEKPFSCRGSSASWYTAIVNDNPKRDLESISTHKNKNMDLGMAVIRRPRDAEGRSTLIGDRFGIPRSFFPAVYDLSSNVPSIGPSSHY